MAPRSTPLGCANAAEPDPSRPAQIAPRPIMSAPSGLQRPRTVTASRERPDPGCLVSPTAVRSVSAAPNAIPRPRVEVRASTRYMVAAADAGTWRPLVGLGVPSGSESGVASEDRIVRHPPLRTDRSPTISRPVSEARIATPRGNAAWAAQALELPSGPRAAQLTADTRSYSRAPPLASPPPHCVECDAW